MGTEDKDVFTEFDHTPTLNFDAGSQETDSADPVKQPEEKERPQEDPGEHLLSPEEEKQVNAFVDKIDLSNSAAILNYGAGTQKKMADFSQKTLESVRSKDLGEVGAMVTQLVGQLREFDADEKDRGFFGNLFHKSENKIANMQVKYNTVEKNVDLIAQELEKHQITL